MPVYVKDAIIDQDASVLRTFVNATAAGNTTVVTPPADRRVALLGAVVVSAGATSVSFRSAGTAITATWPLAANGGVVLPFSPQPWAITGVGQALQINLSAAVTGGVGTHVLYALVP